VSDFRDELIPPADSPGEPDTKQARREFLLLLAGAVTGRRLDCVRRVADRAHWHPDQLVEQQFVERIIVEQFLVDRKFQLLFLVVEQQLLVEQQLQPARVRP